MRKSVWFILLPVLFVVYSLPLFLRVFATTQSVIDEEFHLKQGLHFCNFRFREWDPKITTFPGLYLASVVLAYFDLCSVLGLRIVSLAAAAINVVLLYKIRLYKCDKCTNAAALEAVIISALPPLYFFTHLYYTEQLSLTTVLLFYYSWLREHHLLGSVYAAASVLLRQTNIVWVCMACGIITLDEISMAQDPVQSKSLRSFEIHKMIINALRAPSRYGVIRDIFIKTCFYLLIIVPFIVFIFLNGSIVIGDKRAHEAKLHLPQLFYFGAFTLFFCLSNLIHNWWTALQMLKRNRKLFIVAIGICALIVKFNTLVHPYLLADNRHYIFYIWNRFYGRYTWFKYAVIPLYIYALALINCGMRDIRFNFKLMYWVSVLVVLCFQQLLEVRYFLIPFILFRVNILPKKHINITQWIELGCYVLLNAITFYIFFTKEVVWKNYREPQRIIW